MTAKKLSKYEQILATAVSQKEWLAQETRDKNKHIRPQKKAGIKLSKPQSGGQLERDVRASCNGYMRDFLKFTAVTLFTGGIPTRSGYLAPNPAVGIPDTLVFNKFKRIVFWVEYKRNFGGVLSPEQQKMHADLQACGAIVLVVTSLDDLKSQLKNHNLI
ncbi:hypothetical protein [Fluviispira vulneris]|uniref:hypothetical protein n=1 Tax=Fluviispira vulneris TaxID=2763012 RepID=UPI001645A98C|nr:hypothetical protein [Fluviispira vulneris]